MVDESPITSESPTTEPTPHKETKPETKPKDSLSKNQQMKDLLNKKLDDGFTLKDRKDKIQLQKLILDELHLPEGSYSDVGKFLKKIMIERKLQISDVGFKNDKIGDITVNLIKNSEPEPTQDIQSNVTKSNSPLGALPHNSPSHGALPKIGSTDSQTKTQQPEEPERYMSDSAQKKLISHGLTKLLYPMYVSMGICELDEEEIKEEAKLPKGKQMKKDFEDLAGDIDEYLIENNIKLPALLAHLSIMISIFVVLVLPIIKFKFFSSKQEANPDYDESADKIEVET